jgi:hypothetical protein
LEIIKRKHIRKLLQAVIVNKNKKGKQMSRTTDYILEQEELGNIIYVEGRGYVDTRIQKVDDDFIRERESWIVEQFELSLEEEK